MSYQKQAIGRCFWLRIDQRGVIIKNKIVIFDGMCRALICVELSKWLQ